MNSIYDSAEHHDGPSAAVPPPRVAAPRQERSGCARAFPWVLMGLVSVLLIFSLLANLGLSAGLAAKGVAPSFSSICTTGHGTDEFPAFSEVHSYGSGDTKAVRIPLTGVITRQSEGSWIMPRYDRVEQVLRQIRAATHDKSVRAILLEVNSPGGAITPSDEIYNALQEFRDSDEDRVVLAFARDLMASGGYYAALPANYIIAEPTAMVGSIGVIIQSLNFKGLSDKMGVTDTTIKSGESKDMLNPFRTPRPEELAHLQVLVDSLYGRFLSLVQEHRQLDEAAIKPFADGRVFDSQQSLDAGLIDEIGYWDDACEALKRLLDVEDVTIVRYESHVSFQDWLAQMRTHNPISARLPLTSSKPMYLWQP